MSLVNNVERVKKICPVSNIELTSSGPKWLGKCVNCARCYHLCPHEAIEMGDDSMKRYKNPDIELEELCL
jgi:Fe-S-cluster-containing hydrogenase component 2